MTDTQALLATLAVFAVALAIFAGWRDHRRQRRVDPDAIGWVDWTLVQVGALIALAALGLLAARS